MSGATMPARGEGRRLPRPIGRVLGRLGLRLRLAAMLRGLGTTAIVMAIGAALGMAADFAWDLPTAARWTIWGTWVLAVGVVLIRSGLQPMRRRLGAFELASAVEEGHPELSESLTGAVALLASGAPHGSPELIAALGDQAARSCGTIRAAGLPGSFRRLGAGLAAVAIVAAPALIRPDSFGVLARRFLMPWADIDRLSRFVIAVAPGDRVVAAGSDVVFTAEVRPIVGLGFGPAPESARLAWVGPSGGREQHFDMQPGPDASGRPASTARRFALTIPRIRGSIDYRVTSGDASSRRHRITAIEPPGVASVAARIEPPAYTGWPIGQAPDPSRIEAIEGSRIAMEIAATRPVRSVEIEWPSESGRPAALAEGGRKATVSVMATVSGPYGVTMRDEHGIASRPDDSRRVIVRPDAPPTVSVKGDDDIKEANPRDTVSLGFSAGDDVAVASVELHYAVHRGGSAGVEPESGHLAVRASGLGTRAARGVATLSLASIGARPGDVISYRLRVADNRPAPKGPNVTWSPGRELTVAAEVEPIATRLARLRRSAIQAALDALRKDVAAGRQEAEKLRQAAESARRGDGRWDAVRRRAVDDRERTLRDLIERIRRLARSMAEGPATRELSRPARQIAELEAESTRAMFDRARQEQDPARLADDLRQAGHRLAAVAERLDQLQGALNRRDQEAARRGRLQELADRQQRLADEARAGPPIGRAELDRLRAGQDAVRRELDALVRQTPDLRGDLLEAEARQADRLARTARDLAARQREETRRTGDPSPHADELRAIAEAQRRIEDDARRLAIDVDPPLSENGRSRLNVEAIRQAAGPIERGDVDRARPHLEAAENELRRLARDIEDVPTDPRALAWRLRHRQDALNGEIAETLNRLRERDKLGRQEKEALDARLSALGRRQEAIARLAASFRPPEGPQSRARFPESAAREAAEKTRRAAEAFRQPAPQVIDERKNEARQALNRLADELPDGWRRNEPNRQKLDEARRIVGELSNQVTQHLRETEPRADRPSTSSRAAEELARRLGDAPARMARAIRALKEMEPEVGAQLHRERAARAAEDMERVLRELHEPARREAARVALPAAESRARAALDRLEHRFNGRTPADDRAGELARDQRDLVDRLGRDPGDEAAAGDQRRIAVAMRGLHAPDAALEQAEAVRLADRAARALADPKARPAAIEAARAAADAADRLASRLGGRPSARERAAALARAERGLNEPEALADPATSSARQKAIAAELALLPVEKKGEAAGRVAAAAGLDERASRIDEEPGAARPTASARVDAHARAAEALDALTSRAPKDERGSSPPGPRKNPAGTVAPDPELPMNPEHLATATDLIRRQRQLHERFQAVVGRGAGPQEAIRRDAIAVGQELIGLRDRIRSISDRGVYPAFAAAHHLRADAAQAMEQAAQWLGQAQLSHARDPQRRASENIDRGAQHAEDLAAALRAERMALAAGARPTAGPGPALGSARAAIARAARDLEQARSPGVPLEARPAMDEAARDLRAAALAADPAAGAFGLAESETGVEGDPSAPPDGPPRDPSPHPGRAGEVDLAELKEAIRRGTGRTWGELPGHLRTEILQSARGRYRDEYARLIQLYFREIASGSPAKPVE